MWDDTLGAVQVRTPDDSFDLIVNRWLLYQPSLPHLGAERSVSARRRLWFPRSVAGLARAAVRAPRSLPRASAAAASRQFVEGDVQHWWHPRGGRGTRTRCSDDLLWLPYAVASYVSQTGDESVLDERMPFLEAPLLEPDQEEAYIQPRVSSETASLFEHSVRAIEHAMNTGSTVCR